MAGDHYVNYFDVIVNVTDYWESISKKQLN